VTTPVAVDTNALIYGLEGASSDKPEIRLLNQKVRHYLGTLADTSTPVVLPSVALGEFLNKYDERQFDAVIAEMQTGFAIVDPGVKGAKELALILQNKDRVKEAKDVTKRTSQQIKVDAIIAATALAAGAKEILTHDRDYQTLTGGKLKNLEIDDITLPPPPPPSLFDISPEGDGK
jgi:predicted nucleic acid-binding protein